MANTNEARIEKAAKLMGKALAKLQAQDPELANRLGKALADEVERFRHR